MAESADYPDIYNIAGPFFTGSGNDAKLCETERSHSAFGDGFKGSEGTHKTQAAVRKRRLLLHL